LEERLSLTDALRSVSPGKILIIKPSALGDVVHSLPFLNALRERFPAAGIHWLVFRSFEPLLRDHPMISRLWVVDKEAWKRISSLRQSWKDLRRLLTGLREERFDLVVDLQGLLRSGFLCGATRAPLRLGFLEGREGSPLFYTHRVRGGTDCHAIERYLKVAGSLGAPTDRIDYRLSAASHGSRLLDGLPPVYVVMAPSAGGEAKRWPVENFGRLAAELPWPSLVISGKSDAALVEQVAAASRGRALSLAGRTTLGEMTEVIRRAKAFISNDTGPMHIAAALGVPVFAVFGPTSPLRTGPHGPGHTVITAGLSCSPCFRRKKCSHWVCMERISVRQVLSAIESRMSFARAP
jgi:lipopolysaccharide heptosyltransferase I